MNVRLVGSDRSVWPVELAYRGIDEAGLHVWIATTVAPIRVSPGERFELLVEELPPRTAIVVRGWA